MREGTLVCCTVTGVDGFDTLVDAEGQPARIPGPEHNWRDDVYPGTQLWCVALDGGTLTKAPLRVSRTHDALVLRLLERHFSAIAEGTVRVAKVARVPGRKTKVALDAPSELDPFALCLEGREAACSALVRDLGDEAVDWVLFDDEPSRFACDALAPLEIERLAIDDEARAMDVVVESHALVNAFGSMAIAVGELSLAARLTDWSFDVWESAAYEKARAGDESSAPLVSAEARPVARPHADAAVAAAIEASRQAQRLAAALQRNVQGAGIRIGELAVAVAGRRATVMGVASTSADAEHAARIVALHPDIDAVHNAIEMRR